ncbi:hypothetical protein CK203_071927 [Vitis vinifera]|uniref:Uncharacterized protein n=1 Tax=Vitis vinifera TaxID=29760 RepID=A0A438F3U3_VITVI|nr:hypothetical protein CK203_071927 [Vitis vinifera]
MGRERDGEEIWSRQVVMTYGSTSTWLCQNGEEDRENKKAKETFPSMMSVSSKISGDSIISSLGETLKLRRVSGGNLAPCRRRIPISGHCSINRFTSSLEDDIFSAHSRGLPQIPQRKRCGGVRTGMRRPSWNKSQAIQQVISLKTLLETTSDCGGGDAAGARKKLFVPPPENQHRVPLTRISVSDEESVPYQRQDPPKPDISGDTEAHLLAGGG